MKRLIDPAPWPYPERPRVLIEDPDSARALETATALRAAGYGVAICPGPDEDSRCPVAGTHTCALVDGADAIVSNFGSNGRGWEIVDGLRRSRPRTPVVLNVERERAVAAVGAALRRR